MRIGMISYRGLPRGGIVHASQLAEALARRGHELTFYFIWHKARDGDAGKEFYREMSIPTVMIPYDGPETGVDLAAVEGMAKALSEGLPADLDVYHVHDAVGVAGVAGIPGRKGKMVQTVHHLDSYRNEELDNYFEVQLAKPDGYITVSEFWWKELLERYGYESKVVYNGVDVDVFKPDVYGGFWKERWGVDSEPVILFLGGFEPRKGLEYMILILEQVAKYIEDIRLVVLGKEAVSSVGGERNMVETLMGRTGTTDRVTFIQDVPEEEMAPLFSAVDMVVLPSRTEGWGLALHQGMAAGKPVAAFAVGGVPELVTQDVGAIASFGDVGTISRDIVRILRSPGLYMDMGLAGRKRAEMFTWEKSAEQAETAYKALFPEF